MKLLIDGYNLLHVTGIVGPRAGTRQFEQSRRALLNFLAGALPPGELAETTVVFDAAGAPPGLPRVVEHGGLVVRYARGYPSADDLIEELLQAETSPRRLVVVSSDHRIQRAARRRRATAIDSDQWYAQLVQLRRERAAGATETATPVRRAAPLSEDEVQTWLAEFGELSAEELAELQAEFDRSAKAPAGEPGTVPAASMPMGSEPTDKPDEEIVSPFPEGYGQEALDELEDVHDLGGIFPPNYGQDVFQDDDPEDEDW